MFVVVLKHMNIMMTDIRYALFAAFVLKTGMYQ